MIKHCNLCNSDKTIDNFYKGLSYCKECHKINRNNYYKNNKNKKIKYALDYRKNNIDKVRNIVNEYCKKRNLKKNLITQKNKIFDDFYSLQIEMFEK